ncbi:hypothetical protein GGI64_002001 [Rhizobium leguminosarum]|uniref:Uncharacterized protein n=1 Tax=Rhizobium leguminosarum TaxID=384 RepID=A0A7Z0IXV1_RHILE|nr:hypothetical protein [Rhizobium leguminosarum]NYJ10954.1 hypothetical protein [Rhizobium leguminosarum]
MTYVISQATSALARSARGYAPARPSPRSAAAISVVVRPVVIQLFQAVSLGKSSFPQGTCRLEILRYVIHFILRFLDIPWLNEDFALDETAV